jgi:uncharacterized protein (DUF736 family)
MATIGAFTKSHDGFSGTVRTLTISINAQLKPADRENDKGPDFRVYVGPTEVGAVWKKISNAGREYLSVKLDDPIFPAPIYASLVEVQGENGYALIWSRRNGD